MKLATFEDNGIRTGLIVDDAIIDTGLSLDMIGIIAAWDTLQPQLKAKAAAGGGKPLASVRLCAPVLRPGKVFAIGLNYADHIAESKMDTPKQQVWFSKAVTSVNGPYDPILIARHGPFVDYEAELVAVIGKGGRNIAAELRRRTSSAIASATMSPNECGNTAGRNGRWANPSTPMPRSDPGSPPATKPAIRTRLISAVPSTVRCGSIRIPATWFSTSGSRSRIYRRR